MKKLIVIFIFLLLITCGKLIKFELGYEAENMHNIFPEYITLTDSCALFWDVGTIEQFIDINADSATIKVQAKQDKAGSENALMRIDWPDSSIEFDVFSENWYIYQFKVGQITPGMWQFSYDCDTIGRRLYFDRIIIDFDKPVKDSTYLRIVWNPNIEKDLAGYRIYYGNSTRDYYSQIDISKNDTGIFYIPERWTDIFLKCYPDSEAHGDSFSVQQSKHIGYITNRYLTATAYDSAGNESVFSNEVILQFEPLQQVCRKGDVDCDGKIYGNDLQAFANCLGCVSGDACYNIVFDFDEDGRIWTDDLQAFANVFGTVYNITIYKLLKDWYALLIALFLLIFYLGWRYYGSRKKHR